MRSRSVPMSRAAYGPMRSGTIPTAPDGTAYQSRHNSNELCVAIFERPDMKFEIQATRPLVTRSEQSAALLDRYRKSLSPS